jgi:hypothetical protein
MLYHGKNLYYRLDKYKKADSKETIVGKSISIASKSSAVVSDLSNIITKANAEANAEANESTEII